MPRPTRAKPPVPAWIIRERKRLGLKPRDLADQLTIMGLPVTEGTVRTWEAGRSPHPDNVEGLERIFGSVAPGNETAGDSDLAAAIRENTSMLAKLFEAIIARLPEPPPGVLEDIAGEEDALEQERRRTTTLPRSIDSGHPTEARGRGRLRARSGG